MAKKDETKSSKRRPATTIEGREGQLVSLAVDLAEKQLREGTASAQVISHYLKHGSPREVLEREKLSNDNELTRAKVEALASQQKMEQLYAEALTAFSRYQGQDDYELDVGHD